MSIPVAAAAEQEADVDANTRDAASDPPAGSHAAAAAGTAPAARARRRIPVRDVTMPHTCPRPVRLQVLARAPYFRQLSAAELGEIDDRMQVTSWPADSTLYHAGAPADQLYVVAEGRIKLSQTTSEGTETIADILVPGELFGAMGSLGEPVHTQTATALVGSCVLRIDQDAFRAVLTEHPAVALHVVDDLAERLHRAHADVGGQSTDTVAQRVATALLRLADKLGRDQRGQGAQPAQGILIDMPLSRADLAGLARSTPESVSRVMSGWRKAGIIDSGRRWTAVRDRAALQAAADG